MTPDEVRQYRFRNIQKKAKRSGREVPSFRRMEEALALLDGMKCPCCGVEMVWRMRESAPRTLSLMYTEGGGFGFACFSCVRRGWSNLGDLKACPKCRKVKRRDQFGTSVRAGTVGSVHPYCLKCRRAYAKLARADRRWRRG